MNKKINKYFKGAMFALLLALPSCSGDGGSDQIVKIDSIKLVESSFKLDYLINDSIDFSTAKVAVSYTDGKTNEYNVDPAKIGAVDTSAGAHSVLITFDFEEREYKFDIDYIVHETQNELNFVSEVRLIPMINVLSLSDVENVMTICADYEGLSEGEKAFVQQHASNILDNLNHSEDYLIDLYFTSLKDELKVFYETINKAAYKSDNLDVITGYYEAFINSNFTSLKDVKDNYESTKSNIAAVAKRSITMKDYRKYSIEFLREFLLTNLYTIEKQNEKYIAVKNQIDLYENDLFKPLMDSLFQQINSAGTTDEVDALYVHGYNVIIENFTNAYADDAIKNLEQLYLSLKDMAAEDLARYEGDTIDLIGMFENITTDYLNDNRWWIPDPFKLRNIFDEGGQLLRTVPVAKVTNLYESLALEVTKATLMKNVEMIYTINRNTNKAYDKDNSKYWQCISDRWGAGSDRQMIYSGPLTSYLNNLYGTSDANPIRLCSRFYGDGQAGLGYGKSTIQELIDTYFDLLTVIAPDPLAVTSTSVFALPKKTQYLVDESLDLTGGKILVSYNDLNNEVVTMSNDMLDETTYNMHSIGSQTAVLRFKDPRLNLDQTVEVPFVVLSGDSRFDNIVQKINELPAELSKDNVALVSEILGLIEELEDDKTSFAATFASEMTKLADAQMVLAKDYYMDRFLAITHDYETLNIKTYGSNIATIDSLYSTLKDTLESAVTFKVIDDAFTTFNESFSTLEPAEENVENYKAQTLQSVDRVATVSLNKFSGTFYEVVLNDTEENLKDDPIVASSYTELTSAISSATSIEAIQNAYEAGIDGLLTKVIEAYQLVATENAKQSILDIRAAISSTWTAGGEDDIQIAGEPGTGSDFSTIYTEDMGGYYVWYTPVAYHTDIIYNGLVVDGAVSTKLELFNNYRFCLFDAARSALYRNLFTMFFYNTEHGNPMLATMWPDLYYCLSTFEYDGCLPVYNGTIILENNYRLWYWGWNPDDKATTFEDLLMHYNFDMKRFMNINPEA